jgi:cysteine desulfurase
MIYLDHNATSPVLPEVRAAMERWWGVPANPASAHRAGQAAAAAVEVARAQVAALLGRPVEGIVFTSGATEANHLGLRLRFEQPGGALVISDIEHPCVRGAAARLGALGVALRRWLVDAEGVVRVEPLADDVRCVALIAASHETGVVQPWSQAAAEAAAVGAWLHLDATQAAGRVELGLHGVHSVAISAHKLGGPGGVGALSLPDGEPYRALFPGSQERGRRGGTVPTMSVVGFGVACQLALEQRAARAARWAGQRARIEAALLAAGARVAGQGRQRVGNTTCAVFDGLAGETLVQAFDLRGLCVSAGAACASGSLEPSPTLLAMGDASPGGALRVSLGPDSTDEQVAAFCAAVPSVVGAVREAAAWD